MLKQQKGVLDEVGPHHLTNMHIKGKKTRQSRCIGPTKKRPANNVKKSWDVNCCCRTCSGRAHTWGRGKRKKKKMIQGKKLKRAVFLVWLSHPLHKHTGTWDITLDWTSKQRRKTFCIVLSTNWTKRNIRLSAHMYGQWKLAFLNLLNRGERWLYDLRRSRQVLELWELFLLLWGE